ncbi:hypothetical protein ACFLUO_10010 [Chloroflexota bacterium]
MNQQNIHRIIKSDYLKLVPIMILAFYLVFIPHHNYAYPVHLDEWMHMACSNEIIKEASTSGLDNPFTGKGAIRNQYEEVGFHTFWAVFHQISGLSWLDIFRYFPGIVFTFTVLSVYILARRQGFGWEAAFFTCLIPTTVGIIGPGFLVPVAMGLLSIALFLFVALNFRSWLSYVVLFIFSLFLLSMHAATLVGLIVILAPYILLNLKSNFKQSLWMTLTLVPPFLLSFAFLPWVFDTMVLPEAKSLLIQKYPVQGVDLPQIIKTYGYLPTLFTLLGTFILALRGGGRNYGLALGLLALLLMLVSFFAFHYGVAIMYYRGLLYMMLVASIVAGAGLMVVKNFRLPVRLTTWLKVSPIITQNVGNILCLILIGLTLYLVIPARQNISYYHMIDKEDYEAFVWVRDNINESYEKAVLDPWKAAPFTAITGKKVYTWISMQALDIDIKAYEFLRDGSKDTAFMKKNGISFVYTRGEVHNPNLVEVRENVYLFKKAEESES